MKQRTTFIERNTKETQIAVKLNLDGTGIYQIKTGIGFLDHMLELFSKHALIDLEVTAHGDLHIEAHHTVEDIGIVLGHAIKDALGEKRGICRYGFCLLPMDEVLVEAAIDLSGRAYMVWNVDFKRENLGSMPTELFEDFFYALSGALQANVHLNLRYGRNDHHIAEGTFKAFARAMRHAVSLDMKNLGQIPSTKGSL